ncbi:ferredoxin [Pseudonocardia acaciae]|uniref:ferredoxin n=1 Tax=Pseudonocardia acaciae TaxID=551276 RepID=UPI00048B667A|nr:ferredoxin [Pseudonocardia acaciae]
MRIVVDRNRCTGLGMCEAEAPDLFEVQDDGTLLVLNETPDAGCRQDVEAAVEGCPTEALSIVED